MTHNGPFHFLQNKYSGTIQENWQQLQFEKNYCDVSLACDDKQIEAHKVVISSCSPLFGSILKNTSEKRPLIHITGVKYKHLENLVNFMYKGEVAVAQEDLGNFLSIAKDLQVKGLSGENGKGFNLTFQSPSKPINSNSSHSPKIPRLLEKVNDTDDIIILPNDKLDDFVEVLEDTSKVINHSSSHSPKSQHLQENENYDILSPTIYKVNDFVENNYDGEQFFALQENMLNNVKFVDNFKETVAFLKNEKHSENLKEANNKDDIQEAILIKNEA